VAAVVLMTGVNLLGVDKTAALTRVLVVIVLGVLALVVAGALLGGHARASRLDPSGAGLRDILQAGAFMFFAFAGYARITTLGEEVVDPRRTIPRAINISFAIALAVYALTSVAALAALGPRRVGLSDAPLADAVPDALEPFVRIGAAVAVASVLLSLLAGVARTVFAMADRGDLPRPLAAVDEQRRVPLTAEIAVAAIVILAVAALDLRGAIGFSSFCVLLYYAIANASALTLEGGRLLPTLGLLGCLALALTLPAAAVIAGVLVLAAAAGVRLIVARV
jgi:APA family basic amino acid/polyamine antiporter